MMKIAIVCDWLVTYAGAERILTELLTCYPEADLFAVIDFFTDKTRRLIYNKKSTTTFIQKLPLAKKLYRSYLPLMPLAIEQLDLSKYDLIISSTHAIAKGVITGPNQTHISYIHSPMRYAWDLQHQYLKQSGLDRGIKGLLTQYLLHKMRLWDLRTTNSVDYFFTNSQYIARRIWKVYRREADVIYPPVDTNIFIPGGQKEDFYLAVSRMVNYKRMDLIVESFAAMPEKKLIVIGDGPDFKKVKAKVSKNIQLLGFKPQNELISYLQRAKALVFAAEEDFGIILLEAQACGTPIIAFGKGGALETVKPIDQEHPTGLFFKEQNSHAICQAIHDFDAQQHLYTVDNCIRQAARFTPASFQDKIKQRIAKIISERN